MPLVVVWDGVGLGLGVLGGGLSVLLGAGLGFGALEVADGVGCGLGALAFVVGAEVGVPVAVGLLAALWPAAGCRCLGRWCGRCRAGGVDGLEVGLGLADGAGAVAAVEAAES